jgi:hypothetical protein
MTNYLAFLQAMVFLLGAFTVLVICMYDQICDEYKDRRRTKLRDKLHFAATQNKRGFA